MAKYSSKINKIRTFALSLIFIGFLVMYLGIIFKSQPIIMTIFMLLGLFMYRRKYWRLFLDWNAFYKNCTSSLSKL